MPTWKDVTTIGLALPKTEVSTWYGTPGMKVAGKGFLRLRTEAEGGLVVLCDPDKREMLHGSGDPPFYITPHYEGYPLCHGCRVQPPSFIRNASNPPPESEPKLVRPKMPSPSGKVNGVDAVSPTT